MFTPLIIIALYYWISCLTHNIFTLYYNYTKTLEKRIKLYKYQGIIFCFVFYLLILFNLDFTEISINDNNYTFLVYNKHFCIFFFCTGILIIGYSLHRLYYIMKKKNSNDFLTLNDEDKYDTTIRHLINSLITRHLFFIWYFIITFLPISFLMLIKLTIGIDFLKNYYFSFLFFSLVSFNGLFNFCIKLSDPFMRRYMCELFCEFTIFTVVNMRNRTPDSGINPLNQSIESINTLGNGGEEGSINTINNDNKNEYINIAYDKKKTLKEENNTEQTQSKIEMDDMTKKENINPNKKSAQTSKNLCSKEIFLKNISSSSHFQDIKEKLLSAGAKPPPRPRSRRYTEIQSNNLFSHYNTIKTTYNKMMHNEGIIGFDLVTYHIDLDDNLLRMLAISVALNECRIYDIDYKYKKYYFSLLPWKERTFYKEKTVWKKYTHDTIPDCIPAKNDNRFRNAIFRIKSFSPFVFHHLRLIDKISIDDIIQSLDPIKNLSMINELRVTGGRGDGSISTSWDKKILIKTISLEEKRLFKHKMLRDYHARMRDTKSILCRIYGLFKIEINDKGSIHVLLQKNMCELPSITSLLTFDLKGSTVDRQCISSKDEHQLSPEILMQKYAKKVLKDKDLSILRLKFILSSYDGKNLITCVDNDSLFLEKYCITDYSLLVFVHKYNREDLCQNFGNLRIMQSVDNKYIFNFSIIDFLGTFNFEKKSEKLAKDFVSLIKKTKDTNFSVLDPPRYGLRFRTFVKSIVRIESDD